MSDNIQIIVKLVERCNLNCNYCYMYEGNDQSWRNRPVFLSHEHRVQMIENCKEYLRVNEYGSITLEFHGGEPLLFGKRRFREFVTYAREELGYDRVSFCIQTNGTTLDLEWCELFMEFAISWSISSDGPPEAHDRFRLYHNGKTSSNDVERAIRISLETQSDLFGGVLSVIDPQVDPVSLINYFYQLGVLQLDLLLPDANHMSSPVHLLNFSQQELSSYLRRGFDAWFNINNPNFRIRIFEEMMRGMYGLKSGLDAFGGELWGLFVIESDGTYQPLDVLRIGGEDEVNTGLDINNHSFHDYLDFSKGKDAPACDACQQCDAFAICGGGYLPHRYDGETYDKPSVHCHALYETISHINQKLKQVTPKDMWSNVA